MDQSPNSSIGAQQSSLARLDGTRQTTDRIDSTVARLMRDARVTGFAIAIFRDRKIAYLKAYGMRDTEKGLPLTADSAMTSASLSKAAFAVTVMRLVSGGMLDLDKPIYKFLPKPLPEYPPYADLKDDDRYKKLTLRILLSHTSGFANWRACEDDRKFCVELIRIR